MLLEDDWSQLRIPIPWLEIEPLLEQPPVYNLAPTDQVWTVTTKPEPRPARWGLVPSWSKTKKGKPLINARVETVDSQPVFRTCWKKRRCIIPVTGFYEWTQEGKVKQPYLFRGDETYLLMAGLYTYWSDEDGEKLRSCTVITGPAKGVMENYHNRMPKVLPADSLATWLDPESSTASLHELLQDTAIRDFKVQKVSTHVNSVKNQGKKCIETLLPEGD